MKKSLLAAAAASLIALAPAAHAQWVVVDPTNLVQNLMTAANKTRCGRQPTQAGTDDSDPHVRRLARSRTQQARPVRREPRPRVG